MRKLKLTLLIGLVLVSGCSTTKQVTATYWTQKSGVIVVHHVVGKVDSMEKLSDKELTSAEVDTHNLPKGKYFKVAESHADAPAKPLKASDQPPKKDSDGSKLADVTSELRDLKRQISAVSAQNQRLQDQINAAAQQPSRQEAQQTADSSSPHMSQ
jgi:hypothetical protein